MSVIVLHARAYRGDGTWIRVEPPVGPDDMHGSMTALLARNTIARAQRHPTTIVFGWEDGAPLVWDHPDLMPSATIGDYRVCDTTGLRVLADLRQGPIQLPALIGDVRLRLEP